MKTGEFMTTNHKDALTKALEAVERAKKLPVWDSVPHSLHVEIDAIFKALSAIPADVSTQSTEREDDAITARQDRDAAEAAKLQTLLAKGFGHVRPSYPAGLYAWAFNALTAPQDAQELDRCRSCNDTGDLIDLTGEWRGYCVCDAGQALKGVAAQPSDKPEGNATR
jgi:hypothetical protein